MTKKILWIVVAVLAILIGLYPGIYFMVERTFGLLGSKSAALLNDVIWNAAFYTHIFLGGLALLIGWTQFNAQWRARQMMRHRLIGKIYVIAALLSAVAGIYIGFFATGGLPAATGFIFLGVIWLSTTVKAYTDIRNGSITSHQKMMIFSYAACFSAVTLRIWLPLLIMSLGDFVKAYTIVAWLCWIPNLIIAYLLTRQIETKTTATTMETV